MVFDAMHAVTGPYAKRILVQVCVCASLWVCLFVCVCMCVCVCLPDMHNVAMHNDGLEQAAHPEPRQCGLQVHDARAQSSYETHARCSVPVHEEPNRTIMAEFLCSGSARLEASRGCT